MEMGSIAHSFAILVVCGLLRVFYIIWWRPKSLEKQLRQQGIKGTRYKLLFGDVKTLKRVVMEAQSKPLPLNHSILPRVAPFFMEMAQKYGKQFFSIHMLLKIVFFFFFQRILTSHVTSRACRKLFCFQRSCMFPKQLLGWIRR